MVEITIKKLLGLKSLNAITEQEFETDIKAFEKKDFIDFLNSIPKENISFLFQEEDKEEEQEENQEDDDI
jgi:hypothetical protein